MIPAFLIVQSIQVLLVTLDDQCRQVLLEHQSLQGVQVIPHLQENQENLHTKATDNNQKGLLVKC